jgi:hypothetical protein
MSMVQPVLALIGATSARSISIFSSGENSGVLPGCTPTPTTTRSTMRAARAITSRWPLVTGSKEPDVKPMRVIILC